MASKKELQKRIDYLQTEINTLKIKQIALEAKIKALENPVKFSYPWIQPFPSSPKIYDSEIVIDSDPVVAHKIIPRTFIDADARKLKVWI